MPNQPLVQDSQQAELIHANLSFLALELPHQVVRVHLREWCEALSLHRHRLLRLIGQLILERKLSVAGYRHRAKVNTEGVLELRGQRQLKLRVRKFSLERQLRVEALCVDRKSFVRQMQRQVLEQQTVHKLMCKNLSRRSHGFEKINSPGKEEKTTQVKARNEFIRTPNTESRSKTRVRCHIDNRYLHSSKPSSVVKGSSVIRRLPLDLIVHPAGEQANRQKAPSLPEICRLELLLKRLYVEYFDFLFFTLQPFSGQKKQAALNILLRCDRMEWDVEDYLRQNFEYFQKIGRRPLITHFSGEKAELRYDEFLRAEGYVFEGRDGHSHVDVAQRNHELQLQKRIGLELERQRARGDLPGQRASEVLRGRTALVASARRFLLRMSPNRRLEWLRERLKRPRWLNGSLQFLTDEFLERVGAEFSYKKRQKWARRDLIRDYVLSLIRFERESGKVLPEVARYIKWFGALGIPPELVDVHERVQMQS